MQSAKERILEYLDSTATPKTPKDIAEALRLKRHTVRRCLREMNREGEVKQPERGLYASAQECGRMDPPPHEENKPKTTYSKKIGLPKKIYGNKQVTNTGSTRKPRARDFILKYLREHLGIIYAEDVAKHGYSEAYARRLLSKMAKEGVLERMERGWYGLKDWKGNKKPTGVDLFGGPDLSSRVRVGGGFVEDFGVGGVRRWSVGFLEGLGVGDLRLHDVVFMPAGRDAGPFGWVRSGGGALVFRWVARNGFYASNRVWEAGHLVGNDSRRRVRVNVWHDGWQVVFQCRDNPFRPEELPLLLGCLSSVLRDIHAGVSVDQVVHVQSHVGRDVERLREISGEGFRFSAVDFVGRIQTWYLTMLRGGKGEAERLVERHEVIDARKVPAAGWASERMDPFGALYRCVEGQAAVLDQVVKSLSGMAESMKVFGEGMREHMKLIAGLQAVAEQQSKMIGEIRVLVEALRRGVEGRSASSPESSSLDRYLE